MINFYKDFGIFPDLINLLQLKRIFTFLVYYLLTVNETQIQ